MEVPWYNFKDMQLQCTSGSRDGRKITKLRRTHVYKLYVINLLFRVLLYFGIFSITSFEIAQIVINISYLYTYQN